MESAYKSKASVPQHLVETGNRWCEPMFQHREGNTRRLVLDSSWLWYGGHWDCRASAYTRELNSESCSESTPELSEISENGLFTPRAFFLKLVWSPTFWSLLDEDLLTLTLQISAEAFFEITSKLLQPLLTASTKVLNHVHIQIKGVY